ncbi:hypothetical protein AAMO2058_001027900 [Amorphochlora amoebiformis]
MGTGSAWKYVPFGVIVLIPVVKAAVEFAGRGSIRFRQAEMRTSIRLISAMDEERAAEALYCALRPAGDDGVVVAGFDTEWSEGSGVALIQLTIHGVTYLFRCGEDIGNMISPSLRKILNHPRIFKVGVAVQGDLKRLRAGHRCNAGPMIDLQRLVRMAIPPAETAQKECLSLQSIVYFLTGTLLDKSKDIQCSDWNASALSPTQLNYAAADSYYPREALMAIWKYSQISNRKTTSFTDWLNSISMTQTIGRQRSRGTKSASISVDMKASPPSSRRESDLSTLGGSQRRSSQRIRSSDSEGKSLSVERMEIAERIPEDIFSFDVKSREKQRLRYKAKLEVLTYPLEVLTDSRHMPGIKLSCSSYGVTKRAKSRMPLKPKTGLLSSSWDSLYSESSMEVVKMSARDFHSAPYSSARSGHEIHSFSERSDARKMGCLQWTSNDAKNKDIPEWASKVLAKNIPGNRTHFLPRCLLDGDWATPHIWRTLRDTSHFVEIEFPVSVTIFGYSLRALPDSSCSKLSPSDWVFQTSTHPYNPKIPGSDKWSVVDIVENETNWSYSSKELGLQPNQLPGEIRHYPLLAPARARRVRIQFTPKYGMRSGMKPMSESARNADEKIIECHRSSTPSGKTFVVSFAGLDIFGTKDTEVKREISQAFRMGHGGDVLNSMEVVNFSRFEYRRWIRTYTGSLSGKDNKCWMSHNVLRILNDVWKRSDMLRLGMDRFHWLAVEFPTPVALSRYTFRSRADAHAAFCSPRSWILQGFDGKEWHVVATERDEPKWRYPGQHRNQIPGEQRLYHIRDQKFFSIYRWSFLEGYSNGGNGNEDTFRLSIAQLELFGVTKYMASAVAEYLKSHVCSNGSVSGSASGQIRAIDLVMEYLFSLSCSVDQLGYKSCNTKEL